MSSARTSSASNASGRPAPAARPVFSFSTQRPHALLPRAFASGSRFDRARWWGEIIVPAATGAATTSHAWSLTPAAHMLLAHDVAADPPRLARIRRERAGEYGCSFVLHSRYQAYRYSFVLRACYHARLASRAHRDHCARGDHLCLRPIAAPTDETLAP
jgi:hypothetical protein